MDRLTYNLGSHRYGLEGADRTIWSMFEFCGMVIHTWPWRKWYRTVSCLYLVSFAHTWGQQGECPRECFELIYEIQDQHWLCVQRNGIQRWTADRCPLRVRRLVTMRYLINCMTLVSAEISFSEWNCAYDVVVCSMPWIGFYTCKIFWTARLKVIQRLSMYTRRRLQQERGHNFDLRLHWSFIFSVVILHLNVLLVMFIACTFQEAAGWQAWKRLYVETSSEKSQCRVCVKVERLILK